MTSKGALGKKHTHSPVQARRKRVRAYWSQAVSSRRKSLAETTASNHSARSK